MVKIANYNLPNSPVNRRVYSNCEQVKLYQNDVLVSAKAPITAPMYQAFTGSPAATWNLAHPPLHQERGVFSGVAARGRPHRRRVVARDTARSPGTAAGISWWPTRRSLTTTVRTFEDRSLYRRRKRYVDSRHFHQKRGDLQSRIGQRCRWYAHRRFSDKRPGGACVVLAKAGLSTGTMTVQASATGLSPASLTVTVKASDQAGIFGKPGVRATVFAQGGRWIKVVGDRFTLSVRKNAKTSLAVFDVTASC